MTAEPRELNFAVNRLITGDNLEVLKTLDADSVDLVYLDPPFFSNRIYETVWKDDAERRSFEDRWAGGIDHYIGWLYERVEEMRRVLKPTGSIFLHCDWHADAYIRVHILDKIFGTHNFRNEIIWCYTGPSRTTKFFPRKHDSIFFYTKTGDYNFNIDMVRVAYKELHTDKGKKSSEIWGDTGKLQNPEERKKYLERGKVPEDFWTEFPSGGHISPKERIGYPTQKPEALLERIIRCASREGDLVLDPFMGGGTTIAVADRLRRQWIGIDQSAVAVKVTELRLQKQRDLFSATFTTQLHKYDKDILFNEDPFTFETWIIQQFGGIGHNKKGADKGIDGKTSDGVPMQVKQSNTIGVGVVKNFSVSAKQYNKLLFEKNVRDKKPVGYIIAFSFGKGAVEESARLKNSEGIIIKLVTVGDLVPLAMKPSICVRFSEGEKDETGTRTIELIAAGNSISGIKFYSWDFTYDGEKGFKAHVIMDTEGRQRLSMKPGPHHIAVKVVDNDGLENTETVKLTVNGGVTRER